MADYIHASYRIIQIKPNAGMSRAEIQNSIKHIFLTLTSFASVFQGLPVILQKLLIDTFPGLSKQGEHLSR
jgi:hypothetical protein